MQGRIGRFPAIEPTAVAVRTALPKEEALNFFSERDVIYEAVPVKKATHLCPASRVPCPAPSKIRDLASALSRRAWATHCIPRRLRGHLLSTIDSRSHLSQRRP